MISNLIPEPYRSQLIQAGKFAESNEPRKEHELSVVAKIVDEIRAAAAIDYPGLFKSGQETT